MLSEGDLDIVRRDTALPGLAALLDRGRFAELLRPVLCAEDARLTYLRYKPGMNCLAAYEVCAEGRRVDVYAKAFRKEDAEKLRKSHFAPGRFVLEDVFVAIGIFPDDAKIESLPLLGDPAGIAKIVERVAPELDARKLSVRKLSYKPERRYVGALIEGGEPRAVLKLYTAEGFSEAFERTRALRSDEVPPCLPRRIGKSKRRCALSFEWLRGEQLSNLLAEENAPAFARSAGAAIATVHSLPAEGLPHLTRAEEVAGLAAVAEHVAFLHPKLAGCAVELAERIGARLYETPHRICRIHGDFYAKQIICDGEDARIADLDRSALGDPGHDLGGFVAYLELEALRGRIRALASDSLAHALLQGYKDAGGLPPDDLRAQTAASLLRRAAEPFRYREEGWEERIQAILERADEVLRAPRATPVSVLDPAMPFLESALDREAAAARLSQLFRQPVAIQEARILRHKPGRRCVIEYFANVGGKTVTLIGKGRAKGTDTTTFEIVSRLFHANTTAFRVSEPIGVIAEFNMWLQHRARGTPATGLLGKGDTELAARIAEALCALHATRIPSPRTHSIEDELAILRDRFSELAQSRPGLSSRRAAWFDVSGRIDPSCQGFA